MRGLFGKRAIFTLQKSGRNMYCTSNIRCECSLSIDVSNFVRKQKIVSKRVFFYILFLIVYNVNQFCT